MKKKLLRIFLFIIMLFTQIVPSELNGPRRVEAATINNGTYVYFERPDGWSGTSVSLLVGHSSWSQGYNMTQISGTNIYYYKFTAQWSGYYDYAFISNLNWGGESNSISNRLGYATNKTNVMHSEDGSGNYTIERNYNLFGNHSTNPTGNYGATYSALNKKITTSASTGGSTYVSGNKLNSATAVSAVSGSSTGEILVCTTASLTAEEKDGYSFNGWYSNSSYTSKISDSKTYEFDVTDAVTYYANFKANEYTVTLAQTNATTQGTTSVTATYDSDMPTISESSLPKRTGYTFNGYYSGEDGTGTKYYNANGTSARTWNIANNTTTLYPYWTIDQYTVTLTVTPDGYGTTTGSGTYDYNSSVPISATANIGYQFTQWNDGDTNASRTITLGASNITYTASFEPKTYTINFNVGSGTSQHDPINITYNTSIGTLPSATPPSADYIHLGWYLSENADESENIKNNINFTASSFNITSNDTTEITLYAKYKQLQKFTVSFDSNGGSEVDSIQVFETLHYGFNATFPTPTREGYTFNGWTYEGNLVDESDKLKVEGDHELVASWTAETYNVQLAQTNANTPAITTSVTATYDSAMPTLSSLPSRTGYTFNGYETSNGIKYYNANGTSALNWNIADDTTLYPIWTAKTYTITFNPSNPSPSTDLTTSGTVSKDVVFDSSVSTISVPQLTGYTFQGYYTNTTGQGTKYFDKDGNYLFDTYTNPDDITLYAYWTANVYDVVLNTNGGLYHDEASVPLKHTYDTPTALPTSSNIYKTGYTFNGWYDNDQFTGNPVTEISSTANNTEFFAKWTPISYTIAYDANGGEGSTMSNSNCTYDKTFDLSTNTYSRVGYTFSGWNTQADGKGISYIDEATNLSNLTTENGATIRLYAQWTPITYTVILNSNNDSGKTTNKTKTYGLNLSLLDSGFSQDGYEIIGWSTTYNGDIEYTTLLDEDLSTSQGDTVTLYAIWDIATYNINYTYCDELGEVTENNRDTYTILTPTFTLSDPTRENYTFAGWTCDALNITEPTKNITIPMGTTGDLTIVANWDQKVTFYIDMGIIYEQFPYETHGIDNPIIHLWQNGGSDYDSYGDLELNRVDFGDENIFIYTIDVYFTKNNVEHTHSDKKISYIDMIMFGYDETLRSTGATSHKNTEKLYFPLSGDNNGEEYLLKIENDTITWGGWQVGKTYHFYDVDYAYENNGNKWFTCTYYETTEESAAGTITFVLHIGSSWENINQVWINGTQATNTPIDGSTDQVYTAVVSTQTALSSFEINFEQNGTWFHVDEDGDKNTQTSNTTSNISHNSISSISLTDVPNVKYYDGENLVYTAPFKECHTVQFIEKEGFKLEGWYYDQELTDKFEKGTIISESINIYANYVVAQDYYIYVEIKNSDWNDLNNMHVYKWNEYFHNHNNSWPGSQSDITYLGNGMYRVYIDASKSFDKLIFVEPTTLRTYENSSSTYIAQTQNITMTPEMSYYVISPTTQKDTTEGSSTEGRELNIVYNEKSVENDMYVQKNTSNTTTNEFRFTSGLEDYTNLIEIEEGQVGKEFGYKFIFIKDDSCYVGYWNFTTESMMDSVRIDETLYEASANDYKGYYSLTLTDDVTFKYSDYNQIIVVACYRDNSNNTQIIKAQEYNIIGTGNNVQLYKIER